MNLTRFSEPMIASDALPEKIPYAVQGSIEVALAWLIAFPMGFEREYGSW